jgi:transposase
MSLTNSLIECCETLANKLPAIKGIHTKNVFKTKKFLHAVFWILSNGARWRALPREYGRWNTVFKRFSYWVNAGIWKKLFDLCKQDWPFEFVAIDSTMSKNHSASAGYINRSKRVVGITKGGKNTKITVVVSDHGKPLSFSVDPGNKSDISCAPAVTKELSNTKLLADKGYDSDPFRRALKDKGVDSVIPGRSNRKNPPEIDACLYKMRNGVERFFQKIKMFRRIATRYEKSVDAFTGFLCLAMASVWVH